MRRALQPAIWAALGIALLVAPAVSTASPAGAPQILPAPAVAAPATATSTSPAELETAPSQPFPAPAPAAPKLAFAGDAEIPRFAELPNFHRVDDYLCRGGQPGPGGFARLGTLGVRTVLNLRYERPQIRAEEKAAKAAGLRYFSIPMYGLRRPADQQISAALALINDPGNWPVFVHCVRGADRTGAVVACYRIQHAKWTADRAIEEAMGFGMLRIEGRKRAYIRDFYARSAN